MTNYLLIIVFLIVPSFAYGKITIENVSDALLKEFYSNHQKSKDIFDIEKKDLGDMNVESLTFSMGDQIYKLVIFDNGKIELSSGQKGDLAFQELLSSTTEKTTPQSIVRLVQSFQKKTPSATAYQKPKDEIESEDQKVKNAESIGAALSWSKLIDRVASGQNSNVSVNADQAFSQSVSAARMMNQCAGNSKSSNPLRNAAQNIAQAIVFSSFSELKTGDEMLSSKSKDYEKKGSYSFFDEMDQFQQASPERAFQLLQKTKTSEYAIFQSSLQKSNTESRDPYYLAANRNFMTLVRTVGKEKTLRLMDQAMKKIVLNVERFVQYRKLLPASSVIYDRNKNKYYVDPTLNQPSQARYLLSVVCMYENQNEDPQFVKKMESFKKNPQSKVKTELFKTYEEFKKTFSYPR